MHHSHSHHPWHSLQNTEQATDSPCTTSKLVFAVPTVNTELAGVFAGCSDHAFILLDVDFVSNTDEGEVLWVTGRRLNQEFIFPMV
jgi:hypothetical protein